jgi:hypothetical protein
MRRKRFTAEFEKPDTGERFERLILAHNPLGVKTFYAEEFPELNLVRVTLTPKRKRRPPMWEVDAKALNAACEHLKIAWPVQIRRTSSAAHSGCHGTKIHAGRSTPTHMIVVGKHLTSYHASRVLWHELAHAAQSEHAARQSNATTARAMKLAWRESTLRSRKIKYNVRPCEIEARYIENLHLDDLLTKPTEACRLAL